MLVAFLSEGSMFSASINRPTLSQIKRAFLSHQLSANESPIKCILQYYLLGCQSCPLFFILLDLDIFHSPGAVSYTHLDVYKRQVVTYKASLNYNL